MNLVKMVWFGQTIVKQKILFFLSLDYNLYF